MPAKHVITPGARYGFLTVVRDLGMIDKYTRVLVRCDCGEEITVRYSALNYGATTSCGRCSHKTHGCAGLKEVGTAKGRTYRAWLGMWRRCTSKKQRGYEHYGARGITVCQRWEKFENFLADMGEKPSLKHTIERIDSNGNYEPSNCKWALMDEQARNRRNVRQIEYNGRCMTIADWAREIGIGERGLWMRLSYGWSVERALTTPPSRKKPAKPPKPVI